MKKEYIEPSVKAVEIKQALLSIASSPENQGEAGGTVTPDSFDADFEED